MVVLGWAVGGTRGYALKDLGEMDLVPWKIVCGWQWQALPSKWCSTSPPSLMCLERNEVCVPRESMGCRPHYPWNWGATGTWITWVTHKFTVQEPGFLFKPWGMCLIKSHCRRAWMMHWAPVVFQPLYRDEETHRDPALAELMFS